jgi:hypothetical protein
LPSGDTILNLITQVNHEFLLGGGGRCDHEAVYNLWLSVRTMLKRPWGRPRRRWEDNIKRDLQEVGGGRVDWMELA